MGTAHAMTRWPIDTAAGKSVLVVCLLLLAVGAVAIRVDPGAWTGYVAIALAVALAAGCRALFFRGYFGRPDAADE